MKKNPAVLLILFLIICSLFIPLSVNYTGQSKVLNSNMLDRYVSLSRMELVSTENIIYYGNSKIGFEYKNKLGLFEGITNGMVVFGNFFKNTIVGTLSDYLKKFNTMSLEVKVVWLFFGIFLEAIKNILLSVFDLIVILFILLLQATGSYVYILSYLITIVLITGMLYVFKKI